MDNNTVLGAAGMINSTFFAPEGPFKNKNLRLSSSQMWIVEFPLVLFILRKWTIGNVSWLKRLSRGIYKDRSFFDVAIIASGEKEEKKPFFNGDLDPFPLLMPSPQHTWGISHLSTLASCSSHLMCVTLDAQEESLWWCLFWWETSKR